MRRLFEETHIGGLTVANRLVRSATWEGMADVEGNATRRLAEYLGELARGGVGLIISGYAAVTSDGRQLPGQLGVWSDASLPGLSMIADEVHRHGGKIVLQIVHAGGQTTSRAIGRPPRAPSAIASPQFPELPEELTPEEIDRLIASFAAAADRGRRAGFDGVQIHAAHGYLVSQFLSPATNRRDDRYGGDLAGRSHFLREIVRSIRASVGERWPVLVKLNGTDNLEGGFDTDEAVEVARMLNDEGVDAIEVSGGTPASGGMTPVRTGIDSREREAYNLPAAVRIKNAVSCPVMVVGGFRSFELVEGVIRRGEVDFVAMSRPFIREPALPRRWQEGNETHARCISCNGCFKPGLKEGGIYCVVDRIEQENRTLTL